VIEVVPQHDVISPDMMLAEKIIRCCSVSNTTLPVGMLAIESVYVHSSQHKHNTLCPVCDIMQSILVVQNGVQNSLFSSLQAAPR